MEANSIAGIILAAGKGTRMKSDLPKGLHAVCGLPMVEHVGRAMKAAGVARPIVVVGHGGDAIQRALGDSFDYAWQREQFGTGHATLMTATLLAGYDGPVIVAAGDTPMLEAGTFEELVAKHREAKATATLATSIVDDPHGYGRIVRTSNGDFLRIVEHKDANDEQRGIREVNAALYCFDSRNLFRVLPKVKNTNAQGEYYLTDALEAIANDGGRVVARVFDDPALLAGVNDRWQLAQIDLEMRRRMVRKHALNGVTFLDIDTVSIGVDVEIGVDTVIEPNTMILGSTTIGPACRIGAFSRIEGCTIGAGVRIAASDLEGATVGDDVRIGPFAHLRPGASLGDEVRVGNFVEIKNADLAQGVKVNHLSYVGDAEIGFDTNIGAGTITCNYDGFEKHRTRIGANAFVGSNSTLVAPVTIGDGAIIAAGSVITEGVSGDAMAFGRARQETKEGKAATWRSKKRATKNPN